MSLPSPLPEALQKVNPYEQLSDEELDTLVREAVDIRFRMAMLRPEQVAAKMIEHGCPADAAYQQVKLRGLRQFAAKFYLDCEDAERGDSEAKRRVEFVEAGWAETRRRTAVSRETEAAP